MKNRLIFVDLSVLDYQSLIAALDAALEVILIDPMQDGWEQVARALVGRSGIDAIDIFSHGTPGSVRLGSSVLSATTLPAHADTLAQIGSLLAPSADLLLYGCGVGAGSSGQAFIEQIAAATRANVAASTDITGAAALGGDWMLEAVAGAVDTEALQGLAYAGSLAAITGTAGGETLEGTLAGDVMTGLEGNDTLNGLSGNDILDGGTGADVLRGGAGDDVYRVDDVGDSVVEVAGGAVRVSTAADGSQALLNSSFSAALSADGRFVAFQSDASNLITGDSNSATDIFVKDLLSGAITRASTTLNGTESNGVSFAPMISVDGRFAAFVSSANNLEPIPVDRSPAK